MRIDYVYKICTKQEWDILKQKKSWDGSKSDIEDGFIHLSNREQVNQTLKKYYMGEKNLFAHSPMFPSVSWIFSTACEKT